MEQIDPGCPAEMASRPWTDHVAATHEPHPGLEVHVVLGRGPDWRRVVLGVQMRYGVIPRLGGVLNPSCCPCEVFAARLGDGVVSMNWTEWFFFRPFWVVNPAFAVERLFVAQDHRKSRARRLTTPIGVLY